MVIHQDLFCLDVVGHVSLGVDASPLVPRPGSKPAPPRDESQLVERGQLGYPEGSRGLLSLPHRLQLDGAVLVLDKPLDERGDPGVSSGVPHVDKLLDQGLVEEEPVVDIGQPHGGGGGGPCCRGSGHLPLKRVGDVARQGEIQGVGLVEKLVQLISDASLVPLQGLK